MTRDLRLLLVEDSEDDALLLGLALREQGLRFGCERVQDADTLRAALALDAWDIVLSDYNLPGFGGPQALAIVRELRPDLPFVLVSAAIGETTAVAAMKAGADDYVMKGNLARLGAAIEREIREAAIRRDKRRAEATVAHLSRVREVMSAVNAMIVRTCDRAELYREAVRILVGKGHFRLAWIAIADRGAAADRLSVVAVQAAHPSLARIADRDSRGEAAAWGALCAEKAVVVNDLAACEPDYAFEWSSTTIGSRAAVPIAIGGQVGGVLVLYAREPGFFDAEEMRLIRELADDISFGLDHIGRKESLDYLACYDPVTGLANRTLFAERLAQWAAVAEREGRRLAVAVIDVDRFRFLNESLGRRAGDRLLRRVGERIGRAMGDSHVAHIGSGHFAAVLDDVQRVSDAAALVRAGMVECFGEPFVIDGTECRMSARAGIAFFPDDLTDAALLLRNAESAVERAKASREPCLVYTGQMTAQVAERVALESRLRGALARGEFELHYQPKVTLKERRLAGVEALLRWRSPDAGIVSPGIFVPLLEETGLVCEVGQWVLERARRDRCEWLASGLPAPRVAVNLSVVQLRRADFLERLASALAGPEACIDLEVTETLLMDDIEDSIAKLTAARAMGASVAIDDFGTGYSSLAYLARLPVQALKIDRAFVSRLTADGHALTMTAAITSMARSLRLATIAEGVETEEQAEVLQKLGCQEMQGFLTGRPVSFAEFTTTLKTMAGDGLAMPATA